MHLIKLQKELRQLGLAIFTLNDVVKITGQRKEIIRVFLSNHIKKKNIYRLKQSYYSFDKITDKFQLACIYPQSYIALNSALEFYGTTTQQYSTIDLISNKLLKQKDVGDVKIQNHKVKARLFFGYERKMIENIEFFASNIEKTIIDCIYFSDSVYLSEVLDFIRQKKSDLDTHKIIAYLEKINSSALTKRVGYLLELQGINIKGLQYNAKYERLNKNLGFIGQKNKTWKLIINEVH